MLESATATRGHAHNGLSVGAGPLVCHVHALGVPVRPEDQVPPQCQAEGVFQLPRCGRRGIIKSQGRMGQVEVIIG